MFDPASISAALTSAKAILDLLKNANDAQLALKISTEVANLQGRLIDVQQQALALQSENYDLHVAVRTLKEAAYEENRFHFINGVYWKTSDVQAHHTAEQGNPITKVHWDGPFCPLCKDVDGRAVRLKDGGGYQTGDDRVWECEVHKTDYRAPKMESNEPR